MTTVANYIAIQDSSTTLRPPGQFSNDFPDAHQFANFDAPSLNADFRPVLMFRVNPQLDEGETVTVTFMLNSESISSQLFNTDMHPSWHEIFDANILQEQANILVVNAHGLGAEVVISDVVIVYRLNI